MLQEEAFLEHVKDLEGRAARAEMMQGGEQASREVGSEEGFPCCSARFDLFFWAAKNVA